MDPSSRPSPAAAGLPLALPSEIEVIIADPAWRRFVARPEAVARQAELAMGTADAILLVVDAVVGATTTDEAVARVLRRSKTPVILVANKVDDGRTESEVAALWSLGLGQPYSVSATHGRGTGDLLDEVLEKLPETPREGIPGGGPRRALHPAVSRQGRHPDLVRRPGDDGSDRVRIPPRRLPGP